MKKTLFTLLLAAAASSAIAADSDRITALETRIADLERRIALLERHHTDHRNSDNVAIIINNKKEQQPLYVCSVTPFGKTFEATGYGETLTRSKVRQACNAENSAIFCTDRSIRCKRAN
ncbi:MAG: hypothetical protein Q4A84_03315 [Neisseria sp.]|uniref:hypothetical protein n=1 Tax=Neisseria sp. TaxID=192066 RepID=UPI0026DB1613|nr:hypothetical protein [Neisseria sp.]MDO4640720.1 hypothetical protein [Neisseria sp.]